MIYQDPFMKVELDKLQGQIIKYGAQRQPKVAKYYTKLVNSYVIFIKTLNTILGTKVDDGNNGFD